MLTAPWQFIPPRLLAAGLFGVLIVCGPPSLTLRTIFLTGTRESRVRAALSKLPWSKRSRRWTCRRFVESPPANFQRFQSFLKSDEELLRTIEHGVVFSPMHSWRGQLTDGEMRRRRGVHSLVVATDTIAERRSRYVLIWREVAPGSPTSRMISFAPDDALLIIGTQSDFSTRPSTRNQREDAILPIVGTYVRRFMHNVFPFL